MRKVLLRFLFDDIWVWQTRGNELQVGIGWLFFAWSFLSLVGFALSWRRSRTLSDPLTNLMIYGVGPLAALLAAILRKLPFTESGIPVFGYGFMMFVGFSTAAWSASRRVLRIGQPPEVIWDMMMWALVPGLIGARLTYLLQNWQEVFGGKTGSDYWISFVSLWDGGIVFYGGVFGGIIGIIIYSRLRKVNAVALFDVIAPSLFVGEGFGRIGCFLYGCCFGRACDLPWAVRFPADSLTWEKLMIRRVIPPDALETIPLHPTQIYSSIMAFILAGILAWYFRRRPFDGSVMALGWILYPINRYVLETLRDDEPGRLGTDFTFSQLTSMVLVISGICAMVFFATRNKLTVASAASTGTPVPTASK
jgi:phosphatidylglycerol:prolipoprotein diacylglycerol transferase